MKTLAFIFLLACGTACTSQKEADNSSASKDALMDEVMKLHDEAMIPWADIHGLDKQLQAKIEALDSSEVSAEESQRLQQTSQALEGADKAMMGWMRHFNTYKFDDITQDSAIVILQKEKASIEKVYNQVHGSVDSAKALLGTE